MKKIFKQTRQIDKEAIIEELMEDDAINAFFIEQDLSSDDIEPALNRLLSFRMENNYCKECKGLFECKQDVTGYRPKLIYKDGKIDLVYHGCQYYIADMSKHNKESNIDSLYMPKMIYEADLSDYDFKRGDTRMEIHNRITKFLREYRKNENPKGMFLYGEYQKGKTFVLAAIANELSKIGAHVIIAYYPDLVRELKSRISDNSLESMIRKLKQADVLMLDDIGGEAHSAWIRDEVLGPILQHRLLDEQPTFFSSNVSQRDLVAYMTGNSQKAEKMKAARIYARIHSLSDEYKM
ncbi:MAG: primosomal protein DnaI [Candidatus Izimaplasma sp.]|nr:primosomal protein DnaI [Candidatus Izimaplasma bacterium]